MSELNDTNYVNAVPVAADYFPFVRDASGDTFTVTMQQAADLFQSLAGLNSSVTVLSTDTTLTTQQLVIINSGGATNTTLPASSLNTGRSFRIANKGAGAATILPNGSDTIAGAASLVLAQHESVILNSDGLGYWAAFGAP